MTSCKDGGLPFIWMLGWTDNNSSGVRIRWARWTSSCRFESLQWFQAQVNVVGMIGGGTYPANGLTVLGSSGMSASVFCSTCTITSYNESTNVFIGFKMSKGLNQWTVQLNGAAAAKVIHGYGSIGPNGVISGAPVPSALVTERGFAPTTLYIGIAQGISGRCILVGSKVFFLVTSIGGVKCHLTVEAGTVTPGATIPLSSVVSTSTGSWGTAGQSGGTRSGQGTILGVHTSGAAQHYWAGVGAWSSSIAATCSSVWYSSVEDNSDLVVKVSTLNRSYVSASDGFGYLSIKVFAATFDGLSIGYDSRNGVSLAKDGKKIDPSAIGESIAQGIEDIKNNGIDYSIGTGGSTFDITEASKTAVEAEESGKSKDNATWEGVAAGFSGAKEAFGDLSRTISQLPDVTTAASATIPLKFFYCISDDCRVEAGPGFYDAQFCNSMYMQAESDNGVREVGSDMTLDLFPNINGGGMAGPAGVGVWAGVNINVVINASDLGATNNQVHIVQNPIQVGQRHIYVTYPHENVMTHSITNNVLSIAPQQRDYSTSIGVRNPSFRLVEFSNTNTAVAIRKVRGHARRNLTTRRR